MTQLLLLREISLQKEEEAEGHVGRMQHWNFVFTNSRSLGKHISLTKMCPGDPNNAFNES